MRVRLGHIQGNGTQRVCGPQSGTCAVLRPILSKRGILGTAELSRCLRQKQAKRKRNAICLLQGHHDARRKSREPQPKDFCRAPARRNWFPLKRAVFGTLKRPPEGPPAAFLCYRSFPYASSETGSHHSLLAFSPGTSMATWENQLSQAAPCQCLTSAGMVTASPGARGWGSLPHS